MNSQDQAVLKDLLKKNGYSLTTSRKLVCAALWGQEPLSMRDLIKKLDGKVDRASVYRVVQLFEQLGLIERIYIGWKYKIELSDLLVHHHHHVSCQQCGSVIVMTDTLEIEALIERLAKKHGFSAQTHLLEIRGICKSCQKEA